MRTLLRSSSLPFTLACLALAGCGGDDEVENTLKEVTQTSRVPAETAEPEEPEEVDPATVPGSSVWTTKARVKKPTPLHHMAMQGNAELAALLIEEDGADVNAQMDDGLAPMHVAAGEGHKEFIELLLKNDADPNVQQVRGGTPLGLAIQEGHLEIIQLLLANGADPNTVDVSGMRPLHLLCVEINKIERDRLDDVAEWLIDAGAELDAAANDGSTVLHASCDIYDRATEEQWVPDLVEFVALLIAKGADVNVHGPQGSCALHIAANRQSMELCELLIANGADINATTDDEATPLAIAAYHENAELVEFFQTNGGQ